MASVAASPARAYESVASFSYLLVLFLSMPMMMTIMGVHAKMTSVSFQDVTNPTINPAAKVVNC